MAFLVLPFLEAAVFAGALAVGWAGAVWLRSDTTRRTRLLALPILATGIAVGLGQARFLVLEARLNDPNASGPALARRNVAANRATPLDVLETLAADSDESASSMARHMLERRARERVTG